VARVFGKSHYNVLKAICNRDIPEDFSGVHFEFVEIIYKMHSGMLVNKSYYKMTRDGFNLIAMGFTCSRAMKYKLAFIEVFNAVVEERARVKSEAAAIPEQPKIEAPGLRCLRCGKVKPYSEFSIDRKRIPPLQSWWWQCCSKTAFGKGKIPDHIL
jgi:Rha family phage regulatory protein